MAHLITLVKQLRLERTQAQQQIEKLDSAISVLQDLVGRNRVGAAGVGRPRVISVASRRRMARAQRARWAKVRAYSQPGRQAKTGALVRQRTLSAETRRKIAAAQRARWARVKGQQAKKAA